MYKLSFVLNICKLVNKLWNVAKFIEMHLSDYEDKEFNTYECVLRETLLFVFSPLA